jgi:PBSX family phage terminase large subunit
MKLAQWQKTVADDPSRFKVVVAGRRAGKTFLSIREICYRAREPNKTIFYITSSYRAARMIVWKPLKQRLLDLRWVSKVNESNLEITLKNGSVIALKGADDGGQKLRGISLSYVVIDEAAQCQLEDLWGEVLRPALADQQGGALFISTPMGKANMLYDLWLDAQDNENWMTYSITTLEAGFVSQEEIDQARTEMNDKQFRQEFLATWEDAAHRVAWNFDRDKHIRSAPITANKETILIGMDFNIQPLVCAIFVADNKEDLYQIDEIVINESHTQEMAEEIKTRYPNKKIVVFPDPSGSRRQTSSGGKSDHIILENAGFQVLAPRKHDPVKDRINTFNSRLLTANGETHLFFDKKCKYTIECLDKHVFKEGTQIPAKDGVNDYSHMFDAASYAVSYLMKLRKQAQPVKPQRWTVR